MKSSVPAVLMLMMIVGFVINAFAAQVVPQEQIVAAVQSLNHSTATTLDENGNPAPIGIIQSGQTLGGRYCEATAEIFNGLFTASVEMHESIFPFDQSKILITKFSDDGQEIDVIGFYKENGVKQEAIIETVGVPPKRFIKSIEVLEEKNTYFSGPKMVSQIKCVVD